MINKLLEDNAFYSPAEKCVGTLLLGTIAFGGLTLVAITIMFFVFAPVLMFSVLLTILSIYLLFKSKKYNCPLCLEDIEDYGDAIPIRGSGGVFIHEWCENLTEETR